MEQVVFPRHADDTTLVEFKKSHPMVRWKEPQVPTGEPYEANTIWLITYPTLAVRVRVWYSETVPHTELGMYENIYGNLKVASPITSRAGSRRTGKWQG